MSKLAPSFKIQDKKMELLFVYGTLMHPSTREYVLKHKESASRALLPKYKRESFITPEGKNYKTIVPAQYSRVSGDLFPVSSEDLKKLVSWEDQYNLSQVKLNNGCYAYVFILKNKDELKKE